ncbi:5-bromo-4-chloroindolyl phosphate hydrolysis family protein [Gemmobacter serpentinus]|uniref:5-bromo-4-chloroindolyl phosphate hydrolysis family protein n=1 Tax=Gemmobacter serpentinus TaxID=2652247 RepID=UPI00124CCAC7|nr:5-bromo-4-chloroindolyl phosphate hydrolysis family protein [Gemmobacter serpentinus]
MAQRFGGKYSPDGSVTRDHAPEAGSGAGQNQPMPNLYNGKRPARAGARSNILFLLPFVFVAKGFISPAGGMLMNMAAGGLILAGAWLTREGLRAEGAYDLRKVAKRPAIPRKIFGAVLGGLGIGMGAMAATGSPVHAGLIGLLGGALHLGAFGLDPLRDKGAEGIDAFQADRVARAVDEAETHLGAMKDAILRARDRALENRVDRFAVAARQLFRRVEEDPGDLSAVRKYLGIYLMGARDATIKFADLYGQNRDAQARADYEALLTDLETNFADRSARLLTNDAQALDVEIQVLRERLQYETPKARD